MKLKPCPFCGAKIHTIQRFGHEYFEHPHLSEEPINTKRSECILDGQSFSTEYSGGIKVEQWNTRATPKVKPLEWYEWGTEGASKIYKAYGVGTIYKITLHQDNSGSTFAVSAGRKAERLTQDTTSVVSLDRLKAVAQAHHEARILEALK
jgi:hypothetical protein